MFINSTLYCVYCKSIIEELKKETKKFWHIGWRCCDNIPFFNFKIT